MEEFSELQLVVPATALFYAAYTQKEHPPSWQNKGPTTELMQLLFFAD